MSKPKVNQEICIGCGTCESLCPEIFKMENGKAEVITEECKSCNCEEIANSCPVNAISIE